MNFFDNFDKPHIIGAHRGYSAKYPENTLTAFKNAKADFIEFDVTLTKDNEIVVIHDDTIDRTTNGEGKVNNFTLKELKNFTIYPNEKIPTLEETLTLCKEINMPVNIELKKVFKNEKIFLEKVLKTVKKFKLENKVLISSFEHSYLNFFKENTISIAALFDKPFEIDYLKILNINSVHISKKIATKKFLKKLKDYRVLVYTVNSKKEADKLFSTGVYGIFSDYGELVETTGLEPVTPTLPA
ncbi:glycerophosphoryl diester phosphodiesterase [Lebetimonas natsushimae]|uniref:Glycerophosphoryl diester phosphodiesterase n=1 Tax=Lebetimonas natsushimae TaxID=1936991 RepID=A0A292YIN4_9BACT|nr:glycerophosphoryl diester phosphodiesterase [Lebetimonas natsushimae]